MPGTDRVHIMKKMTNRPLEIAWLGRGGQGVVTACQTLTKAALLDGKHSQAFPEFGPERTGAPVRGFNRVSAEPIDVHSQIYEPDVVVVIDPTLIPLLEGMSLKPGTKAIINTKEAVVSEVVGRKAAHTLRPHPAGVGRRCGGGRVFIVDATRIAMDIFGKPLFNTPMLGALVKVTDVVSMDSLKTTVTGRFGGEMGEKNFSAVERAHREVKPQYDR